MFTGLGDDGVGWLAGLVDFAGRRDNLALREAASLALACNLAMVLLAIAAILATIPRGKGPARAG